MTQLFKRIVCLECGGEMPPHIGTTTCETCGSQWLDAEYDYETVAGLWPAAVRSRGRSLWRYTELLPMTEPDLEISMGEGYTPLLRLYQYEKIFNHTPIFFKDERHEPTSSFKDRQAALSVMAMRHAGITECVLASTGNAAVAYAAYCARAGIKLWLFLTSLCPAEKMREAALYGAEVVKVSGTYDETKDVAAEFAARKGIHLDRGAKAIPGKESMKTLAYEIAEQLGLSLHPDQPGKWVAPDWYIQAVSGGIGPLGVWKGFQELAYMGLIDKMPRLGIIQSAGCAPMVKAYHAGKAKADPVVPKTLITVLATGDPGHSYVLLRDAVMSNDGAMVAIEDGEAFAAMRHLASKAGISVEPATAVAFAGLERMLTDGTIAPDEVVVVNCSGHTFPAESHILGDQYEQYILELNTTGVDSGPQEEGLSAAIQNLAEQVTTIVIVDDTANDRRLVRRLLQRYKRYRIYEARNGQEGLEVIRDRKPDLVIADLTMPEMDGFELLEHLKHDPETANIPVVVISAKSLTSHDKRLLDAYSESVWTKGGFNTRELVDHVVNTLGHAPVEVIQPKQASARREHVSDVEESNDHVQRIIVIDDNPQDLRLARRILSAGGDYQIIDAETGRDGLKAIYEHHPDLIILDLMLPDMDGFTILENLQNDPKLAEIPVIVYSAKSLPPDQRQMYQRNIRTIIQKSSLNSREFLEVVKDELG